MFPRERRIDPPFFKITYIEEGEAKIDFFSRNGGALKKVAVKAKDAFIITPNDIHSYKLNPKMKYCHRDLYISEELMRKCCDMVSEDLYEDIMNSEYPEIFRLSTSAISSISEMMTPIIFEPISKVNAAIHKSIVVYILGQYIALTYNIYAEEHPGEPKPVAITLAKYINGEDYNVDPLYKFAKK